MKATRYLPFVGRLMIGLPFAMSGLSKLGAYSATTGMISAVGLPFPAVAFAVAVTTELGGGLLLIAGYRAQIDPASVGLPILAFVNVRVGGENLVRFMEVAGTHPEVLECHRVTGAESFLLKVAVSDVLHLETLLDALMPYVATTTSMVLSTALAWGNIVKPGTNPRIHAVRSKD